ncbi:hypothetical protein F4782DRAFT_500354 [Xylaria castorea]|nr:hypothetical protein F4782DRAFT_500354 [Xylaria castorea]
MYICGNCNLCPRLCGVNRYETTGMYVPYRRECEGQCHSTLTSARVCRLASRYFPSAALISIMNNCHLTLSRVGISVSN